MIMPNALRPMNTALEIIRQVETALQQDDEAAAAEALMAIGGSVAPTADESSKLAVLARTIDRNDLALRALAAGPDDMRTRMMALQLRTECGEAVADEISALVGPTPGAGPELHQLIGALDVEGRAEEAIPLLAAALHDQPDWVPGHQALAQLRWQAGAEDPTKSFAEAVETRPDHELLWAAWLGTLRSAADWDRYAKAAKQARARLPGSQLIAMVCAEGASEMGRTEEADARFQQLTAVADPHFDAARMRHAMRYRRFDQAARIGERAVSSHGNPECWAWLGAAWRLTGNPRSQWFHRGTDLIGKFDLDYPPEALDALAAVLRSLHHGAAPPLGQSPRGGTQTPGPLLKRMEPEIRDLRSRMKSAARAYIDALPAPEAGHPFLRMNRKAFRFEGAWSILLRPQGRHVSHIHSHGWISSAIYIDLPPGLTESPEKQGWLEFGIPLLPDDPPAGEAIMTVAPRRGRLALFPSIFWHGTRPFDEGERLTAAFDIVPR